jgi:hypothetical protein
MRSLFQVLLFLGVILFATWLGDTTVAAMGSTCLSDHPQGCE